MLIIYNEITTTEILNIPYTCIIFELENQTFKNNGIFEQYCIERLFTFHFYERDEKKYYRLLIPCIKILDFEPLENSLRI